MRIGLNKYSCAALLFHLIALIPLSGAADTAMVLIGQYEIDEIMEVVEHSEGDAERVADRIAEVAKKNGWRVKRSDRRCDQGEALAQVAEERKIDKAVCVVVKQVAEEYELKLLTSTGEELSSRFVGTFGEALDEVGKIAGQALPEEGEENEALAALKKRKVTLIPWTEEPAPEKRRRLLPVVFWTAVGTTAALAIAGGITAGLASRSWKKLDADNWTSLAKWENERDRYDKLQLSSRVLLGTTAGLVITVDVVLLYVTYLKKPKNRVTAFADDSGGMLVYRREF